MRVCVIGLGKVGLPLAVQYAGKGCTVVGCDIDPQVVAAVNRGRPPNPGEEGLDQRLTQAVSEGRLTATTDGVEAVRGSQVVVIIVPVGIDYQRRAELSALDAATKAVASGLCSRALVLVESTVPVGTTRRRVGAALEAAGWRLGRDYLLAYSPERVYTGRIFADLARYPKVVGGIDDESTRAAAQFYSRVLEAPVLTVRDAETAEFAKMAESIYRDVNIALANELTLHAVRWGIDATEAIAAANSQPYSHIHQPGLGVGGHCIPVYPYFLLEMADATSLAALARRINDSMAAYAVGRLREALGELRGKRVLILGLAYRPNVKEAANSSALLLAGELERAGAVALVHDPLLSSAEIEALGLRPASLDPPPAVDAVVLQSYHDAYHNLDWRRFRSCALVLDGRNVLSRQEIEAHGLKYLSIGH
ncbi:MAG: nucleotide sugar dehydrogenase [Dehalococcoidia bacterium]